MKVLEKSKSVLVTGALIVLPAWLAVLVFVGMLAKLERVIQPLTEPLPESINHPTLIATLLLLIACFIVGLMFYTTVGKSLGRWFETSVFGWIPGYSAFRSIADQLKGARNKEGFQPALIDVEDGSLAPAFLIEEHADELCTVFMPSSPTPLAGGIFIMDKSRVHPIEVSVATMMRCVSKWGAGSHELLKAYQRSRQK